MRAVIQRVVNAAVVIDGKEVAAIDKGFMCLIGISKDDTEKDAQQLATKIVKLRVFDDGEGKMNKSLADIDGELLLVSQFTLYGDCKKGNRPSFISAMPPTQAAAFYDKFVDICKELYPKVQSGVFQAEMHVKLVNDGPITILMDTEKQI